MPSRSHQACHFRARDAWRARHLEAPTGRREQAAERCPECGAGTLDYEFEPGWSRGSIQSEGVLNEGFLCLLRCKTMRPFSMGRVPLEEANASVAADRLSRRHGHCG